MGNSDRMKGIVMDCKECAYFKDGKCSDLGEFVNVDNGQACCEYDPEAVAVGCYLDLLQGGKQ